jgi:phosphoglycerol transferase MdoB-like AlkP superfamily enzyme
VGKGSNQHYVGHNPLGALAVYALLLLGIIVTASGYGYQQLDQEWLEEVHEVAANGMLALVVFHVLGVIISSIKHRENLVRGMVTGNKQGEPQQEIKRTWTIPALLLLLLVGGFWFAAWQQPALLGINGLAQQSDKQQQDDDD